MSFKTTFTACAGILLFATSAFAQAGGSDVPGDAKMKAGKDSSGMKSDGMKSGAMKSDGMKSGAMGSEGQDGKMAAPNGKM